LREYRGEVHGCPGGVGAYVWNSLPATAVSLELNHAGLHGTSCLHSTTPVCVEQSADRAELLRSTTTFHRRLKTFPLDMPMDTGKQTDGCYVNQSIKSNFFATNKQNKT